MRRGLLRVAGAGVAPLALAVALTAGTAWASAPEPTVPEPAPSAPATEPDVTEPDVTEPAATEPTTTAATAPVSTLPPEPTVPETQPATTVATDQECVDGETSESGGHTIACVGGVWVAIADPPAPPAPPAPADTTPVDTGVVDGVEVAIIDAPLPPPIPAAPSRPTTTTLPRPAPPVTPVGQVAVEIAVVDLVLAAWG